MAKGIELILQEPSINTDYIMAYGADTSDDYKWRHPTWEAALKREDAAEWIKASKKEEDKLLEQKCIPYLDEHAIDGGYSKVPKGVPVIHCMRLPSIKADGTYKMRIIYFGNQEKFDGDTYSPTGAGKTFWLLTRLAILLNLHSDSLDLENAFCHEPCPRDLYVVLDGKVRKPEFQFYGGKDGPLVFFKGFAKHNEKGGYLQSKHDLCVFVKYTDTTNFIWIYAHVDDFKCFATSPQLLLEYKLHLEKKYTKVKRVEGNDYLGIHEEKLKDGRLFTKPKALLKLFETYLPNGPTIISKSFQDRPTTMIKSYLDHIDDESDLTDNTKYRSCLGLLQQQLPVRPDIAFTISKLATRSSKANSRDMDALIHLINYLWYTKNRGLFLKDTDKNQQDFRIKLIAFADAAGSNEQDSKSQYAVTYNLIPYRDGDTIQNEEEMNSETGKKSIHDQL